MSEERRVNTVYVEQIAERVAARVVEKTVPAVIEATFQRLGVDTRDPISVQRQMGYLAEATERASDPEVKKDRDYLRRSRVRCERVQETIISKSTSMVVWALIMLLVLGTATYFGLKIPSAKAHGDAEWIMRGANASCCGPMDCFAVEHSDVHHETREGGVGVYIVKWRGRTHEVPEIEAKRSERDQPWVCEYPDQSIRCLFILPMGA